MAWTVTNWTDADWSQVAAIQDWFTAFNERASVHSLGDPQVIKNIDGDVQLASWWRTYQQWIANNLHRFVRRYDNSGNKLADGYYNTGIAGALSTHVYSSLTDLLTRATGGARTDWRRYTTHPDDAGADLGGVIQSGDIIGPWLFEDLQDALNALTWTTDTVTWHDLAADSLNQGNGGWQLTQAAAKAAAIAAWPANAGTGNVAPLIHAYEAALPGPPQTFLAVLNRTHTLARVTPVTTIWRDVDWYIVAATTAVGMGNEFAAQGDGTVNGDLFRWLVDADDATNGLITSSGRYLAARFGVQPPTWHSTGPAAPLFQPAAAGYTASASEVLLRWDAHAGNGFQYTG